MLDNYDDIMNPSELAEALYVGRNRAYEILKTTPGLGFRLGNTWKVPKENVIEYIRNKSRK
jgi:hypothetical protein